MKYYISYQHTAGPNEFYLDTPEDLDKALERIEEDPHVVQSSVKIWEEL